MTFLFYCLVCVRFVFYIKLYIPWCKFYFFSNFVHWFVSRCTQNLSRFSHPRSRLYLPSKMIAILQLPTDHIYLLLPLKGVMHRKRRSPIVVSGGHATAPPYHAASTGDSPVSAHPSTSATPSYGSVETLAAAHISSTSPPIIA